MTISAERREEIEQAIQRVENPSTKTTDGFGPLNYPTFDELRALLSDSARLERIERQVRELADKYESISDFEIDPKMVAGRLRAIVGTGPDHFEEGRLAYFEGLQLRACPYEGDEAAEWEDGYIEAEEEDEG